MLGTYKKKIIRAGGRYAIPFNGDGKVLFEDTPEFYVQWKDSEIGRSLIFYPEETQYGSKVKVEWYKQSAKIHIPEYYRKLLGVVKGSVVDIKFKEFEKKIGFEVCVI